MALIGNTQTYCPGSSCNSNDINSVQFNLELDGVTITNDCETQMCEIGEEITVDLIITVDVTSASVRPNFNVKFTLMIDGVPTPQDICLGDPSGDFTMDIADITWSCGSGVTVEDFYASWGTPGNPKPNCEDCASPKCERVSSLIVVEPLPQVTCPADTISNACDFVDEAAVLAAYNGWLSQFQVVAFGNEGTVTQNFPQVSFTDFCNGASVIAWIKVEDDCALDSCGAMFTINPAPDVTINCDMDDVYLGSCMTQTAVQSAYDSWRAAFTSSGGCTLTDNLADLPTTAPDACDGDTITFIYEVTDTKCGGNPATCTSTFGVAAAPEIIINCPKDTITDACLTQAEVDGIYALWVAGFTTSGGCNPMESFSPAVPATAPDVTTGGSYTVMYTVTGDCDSKSCTSSFTVPTPMTLTVTCPMDTVVLACTPQATIDQAYANWIAQFSDDGGCPDYVRSSLDPVAPLRCTGEVREIIYAVIDAYMTMASCTATFEVIAPDPFTVTGPADLPLVACTPQNDINNQFSTWLGQFNYSGGCVSYNETGKSGLTAPNRCNPSPVIVNYIVTDGCGNSGSHMATFSVAAPDPLVIVCPENVYLPACSSPTDITNEFNAWLSGFSASGGCNPQITPLPSNPASQCTGDTLEFIYKIEDLDCATEMVCTTYFGVANPTPLTYNANTDTTISSCTDQATVDAAFDAWLAGFNFAGGCNASDNSASFPTTAPSVVTGGMETINYAVTSDCETPSIPSATFLVPEPGDFDVVCPPNREFFPPCSDQFIIDDEFQTWVGGFSIVGGCDPMEPGDLPTTPTRCLHRGYHSIHLLSDRCIWVC